MDDLAICKRIAEIDLGDEFKDMEMNEHDGICVLYLEYGMIFRKAYNPLTDDALCFQLMVKYRIVLDYDDKEYYAMIVTGKGLAQEVDKSPNKAICLAIIEANNENN